MADLLYLPQPGPQTEFASTTADIAIYGGAAGGGKTYALLLEPLRHYHTSNFSGVIFRKTTKQVRNEGGLWDEAQKMYCPIGAEPTSGDLTLTFPSGMTVGFGYLEYEKDIFNWQGSQFPFLGFDELTHFSERQFFYMLSRLRSASGVRGYVRATCNPDADSWVREFIAWWIGEDGLPIPERSGKIRWFARVNGELKWANNRKDLLAYTDEPKSVTFISAKLEDNAILMKNDPGYKSNLDALPLVDRAQLRDGNWNVRASAGLYFKKQWFEIVDAIPAEIVRSIRYWDRASTEGGGDWTAGVKLCKARSGIYYVTDVTRFQYSPGKVESAILNIARADKISTVVGIEQDPGQAGVADAANYVKLLSGFSIEVVRASVDKVTRAKPASAQVEAGNIKLLRGDWNKEFIKELENFPEGAKDDQVDALSGAFNLHSANNTGDFTKKFNPPTKNVVPSLKGSKPLW